MRWSITLVVLLVVSLCSAFCARAAGPHGLQPGWVIDDAAPNNNVLFTDATAKRLTDAGAGWMRLNFRIARHQTWDATLLSRYDIVVDTARRHGIQIVALVGHEAWNGGQSDWQANARETGNGHPAADGSNRYMTELSEAAVQLMIHFRGRIRYWELWNEPNAWTQSYGVGGPFIYPSNFAYYIGKTYSLARSEGLFPDVQIVSGGLFAHDIGGRDYAHATANNYIPATYAAGRRLGETQIPLPDYNWNMIRDTHGTYPVDAFGYHVYLDDNAEARPTDTTSIGQYIDWFRSSYRLSTADGPYSAKPIFITEIGFHTPPSSDLVRRQATLANQAASVQRTMVQVLARPWVQTCIFFQEQDNPFGNLFYGMYETDGSPKPARDTLREYSSFEGRRADRSTNDAILGYYTERGQGQMGSPTNRGRGAYVGSFVDSSAGQDYDGGALGPLKVVSGSLGTFTVRGAFLQAYTETGDVMAIGAPRGEAQEVDGGRRQSFKRGVLLESGGIVTRHLYGDVDSDAAVTMADAGASLRMAAGFDSPEGLAALRADVSPPASAGDVGDGTIDIADAIRIADRAANPTYDWP